MKKLVLRFNSNPGHTLEKVVGMSNSLGLRIASIEDVKKTKSICLKIVTIIGYGIDLEKMKASLVRLPAVTFKDDT